MRPATARRNTASPLPDSYSSTPKMSRVFSGSGLYWKQDHVSGEKERPQHRTARGPTPQPQEGAKADHRRHTATLLPGKPRLRHPGRTRQLQGGNVSQLPFALRLRYFPELQSQTAALRSSPTSQPPFYCSYDDTIETISLQDRKPGLRLYGQKSISWRPIAKRKLALIFHTRCFEVATYVYT